MIGGPEGCRGNASGFLEAHREELETQNGDDAGQETHNHGAERRQHHLTCGSHGDATGQSSILDVDLEQEETPGTTLKTNVCLDSSTLTTNTVYTLAHNG